MRGTPQAISGRLVARLPVRRWPDWISRVKPTRRDPVELIERRARQAQLENRAWDYIPDPRWYRGRR